MSRPTPLILRGPFFNPLKACIDKVEIVCKYRAKCSVFFLYGCVYHATVRRWEGWKRGKGECRCSWRASFLVEKSGRVEGRARLYQEYNRWEKCGPSDFSVF